MGKGPLNDLRCPWSVPGSQAGQDGDSHNAVAVGFVCVVFDCCEFVLHVLPPVPAIPCHKFSMWCITYIPFPVSLKILRGLERGGHFERF